MDERKGTADLLCLFLITIYEIFCIFLFCHDGQCIPDSLFIETPLQLFISWHHKLLLTIEPSEIKPMV